MASDRTTAVASVSTRRSPGDQRYLHVLSIDAGRRKSSATGDSSVTLTVGGK